MDTPAYTRREARLGDFIRAAVVLVLVVAAANWVGWALGSSVLTKVYGKWPPMTPWTALWLAMLAVSIWLQSGCPSARRERCGRGLAVVVGALAVVVFVE